jgi:8-oxo-dGTP diphosphatase
MEHDYGVKYVRVTFFIAFSSDSPTAEDGQAFRWVMPEELETVNFLDADRPVAREIRKKSKKISCIYNKMLAGSVNWVSRQP